jgi:hypothetical protein
MPSVSCMSLLLLPPPLPPPLLLPLPLPLLLLLPLLPLPPLLPPLLLPSLAAAATVCVWLACGCRCAPQVSKVWARLQPLC